MFINNPSSAGVVDVPAGDGPHEPALLTQPSVAAVHARELRDFLIERAETEGDLTAGHFAACYSLKAAVAHVIEGLKLQIDWAASDREAAPMLREQVRKLERDVVLAKQPLDAQMARLNRAVITMGAALEHIAMLVSVPGSELPIITRAVELMVTLHRPWVITNGQDTRYRFMVQGVPKWTQDRKKAIKFFSREDAEMFCREDEDVWHVRQLT